MEQVMFAGIYNLLNASDTEYSSLQGGAAWNAAEARHYRIVSTDGIIKNLRVKLSGSPGAGNKYTFTLMLNGAPTALTFDIENLETSGSNMVNEIDVTGGDYVSLQCVPDSTPSTRYATWTSVFKGDTSAESLILGGSFLTLDDSATEYGQIMGGFTGYSVTENNFRQVCPTAGTIKNFYVKLTEDPGTSPDAYRFTVRVNGVSPLNGLVVTITADNTTGNDLINDIDVVAGDVLTMMIEPLNTPSATPMAAWGMTFVADIDGESIVLGGSHNDLDATATEYNYLICYEEHSWTVTETQRYQLGQVCTLKKLHVLLSAAPGAGNDRDFAIRIAGTNVVTLQISDAATTGDSGALSDTVALDEYVNLRTIPTDTPDVADAYWGAVCYIAPPAPTTSTSTTSTSTSTTSTSTSTTSTSTSTTTSTTSTSTSTTSTSTSTTSTSTSTTSTSTSTTSTSTSTTSTSTSTTSTSTSTTSTSTSTTSTSTSTTSTSTSTTTSTTSTSTSTTSTSTSTTSTSTSTTSTSTSTTSTSTSTSTTTSTTSTSTSTTSTSTSTTSTSTSTTSTSTSTTSTSTSTTSTTSTSTTSTTSTSTSTTSTSTSTTSTTTPPDVGVGRVERIRVYRRRPFRLHIQVTGAIQKPFEDQLYLDANLVHVFSEPICVAAIPVKPFSEEIYFAGAINIMKWLYPELETLETKEEHNE